MQLPTAEWNTYLAVQAGAAATLTGLVFVAVSLNIKAILSRTGLPSRTAESLLQPLTVFFIASLALVPGQPQGRSETGLPGAPSEHRSTRCPTASEGSKYSSVHQEPSIDFPSDSLLRLSPLSSVHGSCSSRSFANLTEENAL